MLAHKLIVLVGDEKQLPPVCNVHKTEENEICKYCCIYGNLRFRQVSFYKLSTNFRHASDPIYLEFLNYIRDHVPTQKMIDDVLGKCMLQNVNDDNIKDMLHEEATILCSHKDRVAFYNNIIFNKCFPDESSHIIMGEVGDKYIQLPVCAIGAKVMITSNVSIEKGAANGTIGTIVKTKTRKENNKDIRSLHTIHVWVHPHCF
jgi:hypothetical protein